ncbi:ABC transporter permease [Jatrophihabitans sp.]|uniref:ABC transporter permease n=1 Tax=Jatrophihabitans sp. TaxID=1932789 RepID=UPI0030C7757F
MATLYVLIGLIIAFSLWKPSTFPEYATLVGILQDGAIGGLIALGLVVPLAAGVFDLSVGYMLGFGAIFAAWLVGNTSWPEWLVIAVSIAACAVVGLINGLLVVKARISSFIATLAMGSILQAGIQYLTGGQILTKGVDRIGGFASVNIHQITLAPMVLIVLAVLLWVLMQHTVVGRHLYATGLGGDAAVLAGVRTRQLQFGALIVSAAVAGLAGVLVVSNVGAASPDTGPSYMIPAFAAAFLGATQFKPGFFNPGGTVLAILMLQTLTSGLALAGVSTWVPSLCTGVILIAALAVGQLRGNQLSRLIRLRRVKSDSAQPQTGAEPALREPIGAEALSMTAPATTEVQDVRVGAHSPSNAEPEERTR